MTRDALSWVWCLAGLLGGASPAAAQYEIAWWTVDGGGVTHAPGGTYALSGTAGQPDAGGPYEGAGYTLHSGFWSIASGGGVGVLADLGITKTDGAATAVPGAPVTYTIVASNAGPSAVTGSAVADTLPAAITGATWTCAASAGSTCPTSGSGNVAASVDLLAGGTATFTLTGTIAATATGLLSNTASVAPPTGVLDPVPVNNAATDVDTLTPLADLALAKSDSPDPVAPGGALAYTIAVTNLGPSASPGMTVVDTLPAQVGFVSASAGCANLAGVVTCTLGALAPSATATVTIQTTVSLTGTSLANTAIVTGAVTDPVAGNDSDTEPTALLLERVETELAHGTRIEADLAGAGGVADVDLYRIALAPRASYEVVVDGTSGDVGAGAGPLVDRVLADGTTVLQSSQPVGTGSSRTLRFANATSAVVEDQLVRVRSASCASDCGTDDVYRIRAWETTASIPRFNNSATQVTVLVLQNRTERTVTGTVYYWSLNGALRHQEPLLLVPKGGLVFNTAAVTALQGQSGAITIAHDGGYDALVGKGVALEPATGFAFDSLLAPRPR